MTDVPSVRETLPPRRRSITQKVKISGHTIYYTFGTYPDGRVAELFVDVAKAGAALRSWASEAGMLLSVALQHGTPLSVMVPLFLGRASQPNGPVQGHRYITRCTGIMDLIVRDLGITFLGMWELADTPPEKACDTCGGPGGTCYDVDTNSRTDVTVSSPPQPGDGE